MQRPEDPNRKVKLFFSFLFFGSLFIFLWNSIELPDWEKAQRVNYVNIIER